MGQDEFLERDRSRRQSFFDQVCDVPQTNDGGAAHVEDDQALGLQFQIEGVARNEADSHAGHHRLLDGLVARHFHSHVAGQSEFVEILLHGEARTGTRFANDEILARHRLHGDVALRSQRMIGGGDLTLESAGTFGQSTFGDVRRPERVQKVIYEMTEAKKRRLT